MGCSMLPWMTGMWMEAMLLGNRGRGIREGVGHLTVQKRSNALASSPHENLLRVSSFAWTSRPWEHDPTHLACLVEGSTLRLALTEKE